MTNIFKIKKITIVTFCMVLFSLASFAQEYSDETIGFDVARITASLKEHGVTDQDLKREIAMMREMQQRQYVEMKKAEETILQKIEAEQSTKTQKNRAATNAKTATIDVPLLERQALIAFYNSTNGPNWKNTLRNDKPWLINDPTSDVSTWYEVSVIDGHVISLDMDNNSIKGTISTEIGNLTNLQYLGLANNQLTGNIPTEIGNLTNLQYLSLNQNQLTGSIPTQIGNLPNLEFLALNSNQLTGSIPTEIGNLTKLYFGLYLGQNQLTGSIPTEIGNLTKLSSLSLGPNQLTGSIPTKIWNLTNLSELSLDHNQLTGSIPTQIGNLSNLGLLTLNSNQLTGRIPTEIGQLTQLWGLFLNSNKLSGTIPTEIGKLTRLQSLWLDQNQLNGTLPTEISQLTQLEVLIISNNQLSGNLDVNSGALFDLRVGYNRFRFVDFAAKYSTYKSLPTFSYTGQSDTDTEKTITKAIGETQTLTMYEDNRFTPADTYQWYKNGEAIRGATARQYTLSDLTYANAGDYYCVSKNPQMTLSSDNDQDLTLTRNTIHLNVITCDPIAGEINSPLEEFCNNTESAFSFASNGSNLTYDWSATTTANVVVNSMKGDTSGSYKYTFTTPGSYIIKAEVTEITGCKTTFTKLITVVACDFESACINEPVNMSFETTAANLNYNWYTLKQGSDLHLNPIVNTTGLYTFTPKASGTYTIYLNAYQKNDCQFEFKKTIIVESCEPFVSCTKSNRNSPVIKNLFTTLVNKLISLPAAAITNGYTCDELTALAFYVKDKNPAIYNFVHDTQQGFIAFSFADHTEYDVKIATNGNVAADFNLDDYESDTIVTELTTTPASTVESYINHVDFCSGLYCVSHIAFVVDESGSINATEAGKIKKQLKKYIQQQANDNDKLQSNVYVSLIGMSDSDTDTRTDHIRQVKVTNDPDVLTKFNNWIDKYGSRNGKTGVSASSDYWKSGLDVALNSVMKPSVVIMITDGCETANVNQLRDGTMSRFSNSKSILDTSLDKPHLYVMGIENGFYVDGGIDGIALASNQNPNYVQTLPSSIIESRVVPNLRTSLKYLLDYPLTGFPQADIENFRDFDYYGYETFDSLGTIENEAFLSDNLKLSGFSCGNPTDKNYCSDCLSFQPFPGKEYMLSAWVKEESSIQVKTYENAAINIVFYSDVDASELHRISARKLIATGDIIDGWQRITSKFLIPEFTKTISIELENKSNGVPAYYDDIRIHPLDGSIKTFVYDPETFKLMSELDENNYSTFYEYDNEGGLVRVKKETAKGVKTIQETRSGNVINTTQN
jgi:Leucine-rich repeat (LRR) protein